MCEYESYLHTTHLLYFITRFAFSKHFTISHHVHIHTCLLSDSTRTHEDSTWTHEHVMYMTKVDFNTMCA